MRAQNEQQAPSSLPQADDHTMYGARDPRATGERELCLEENENMFVLEVALQVAGGEYKCEARLEE